MKTRKQIISDINGLATAVFDNGRRGQPRPGCDCVQCFGYCMIDQEQAQRDAFAKGAYTPLEVVRMGEATGRPLNLDPEA